MPGLFRFWDLEGRRACGAANGSLAACASAQVGTEI
jgi:hypothetical protein